MMEAKRLEYTSNLLIITSGNYWITEESKMKKKVIKSRKCFTYVSPNQILTWLPSKYS